MVEYWFTGREEELIERFQRQESFKEIGRAMGATGSAVRSKLAMLGYTLPPKERKKRIRLVYSNWTGDMEARAIDLWQRGASAETVAIDIGTTRNAIIGKMRRMGIKQGSAKPTEPPPKSVRAPPGPRTSDGLCGKPGCKNVAVRPYGDYCREHRKMPRRLPERLPYNERN